MKHYSTCDRKSELTVCPLSSASLVSSLYLPAAIRENEIEDTAVMGQKETTHNLSLQFSLCQFLLYSRQRNVQQQRPPRERDRRYYSYLCQKEPTHSLSPQLRLSQFLLYTRYRHYPAAKTYQRGTKNVIQLCDRKRQLTVCRLSSASASFSSIAGRVTSG